MPKPHIPNPVPLFTGRQAEITEITNIITDESTRLLNIWGTPGFGKTSTAIAAAHHILSLGQSVYFFKFQGISTIEEFLSKILSIFKSKLVDISLTPLDRLFSIFREISCRIILIFDNLDDLLLDKTKTKLISALEEFLDSSINVNVIFTTRELLETMRDRVKGFRDVRIRPMSPISGVEFVRQLLPSFSESIVAEVVTISSHVPLAMKLVASLVENSSEEEANKMLEEIKSSENLLEVIDSPYEKKMQKLFEASFGQLSLNDKHALISLTVFESHAINKHTATNILSGEAGAASKSVRSLETLVKKSLIDQDLNCEYYYIHRLIYFFVKDKAKQSEFKNVFNSCSIRFCRYYLLFFEKLNDDFLTGKSLNNPELLETMKRVLFVMEKSIVGSDFENCQLAFRILSKSEIFFSLVDLSFSSSLNIFKVYDLAMEKSKSLSNDIALFDLNVSTYFQNIACSLFVKPTHSSIPRDIHAKINQLSNSLTAKLSCYEGIFDYYNGNVTNGVQQIEKGLPGLQGCSDHQVLKCLCFQLLAVYNEHINEFDKFRQFREMAIAFCTKIGHFNLFLIGDCGHNTERVGESVILFNYLFHQWSKAFLSKDTQRYVLNSVYNLQQDREIEGCNSDYLYQILTYGDCLLATLGFGVGLESICDEKIEFLNKSFTGFHDSCFPYSTERLLNLYYLKSSLLNRKELSIEACRDALDLSLQRFGERHRHTAQCYFDIGKALNAAEDYTPALKAFEKALKIISTVSCEPNQEDSDILTMLYFEMGITYDLLDKEELAMASFEKALSLEERKKSDPDDITVSKILFFIGSLQFRSQNFTAALETYKRALCVRKRLFSEKRLSLVDLVESYLSLGRVHYTLGNYTDGRDCIEIALDLLENTERDPTYVPKVTLFYVCLLNMKLEENVYMDLLHRTFRLIENHNRVLLPVLHLSVALRQFRSEKLNAGYNSLQKALEIELEDTLTEGAVFRDLCVIKFIETVKLLLNIGDFKFAKRTLDKALKIVESLPQGIKERWMFRCYYFQGVIHMNNREYDLVIKSIEHALLELPKASYHAFDKFEELECLKTIAIASFCQGAYENALSFLYGALPILQNCFPEGSEDEANVHLQLAKVAQKMRNRSLFVNNLRLAYKVLSKVLGEKHPKTQKIYIFYVRALISEV